MSQNNDKEEGIKDLKLLDSLKDMKDSPIVFKLLMEEARKRGI